MQLGGLSMAMGAFLAGVLLSESSFRHQLEADVVDDETFDRHVGGHAHEDQAPVRGDHREIEGHPDAEEALERTALMAQGGEFAFVLYAAAASAGLRRLNPVRGRGGLRPEAIEGDDGQRRDRHRQDDGGRQDRVGRAVDDPP
jgi:hypothetical protein